MILAFAEHLTPESGSPFGFDPETHRPLRPETETGGLFLAPDGNHVIRLQKLVETPETPINLLFEAPKTPDERLNNARLYASVAEFHLSILGMGSTGMHVPEHETAIGLYPAAGQGSTESRLAIFRKVPYLAGVSLDMVKATPAEAETEAENEGTAETVLAEAELQQVIKPLFTYYKWLNTTNQPFFLKGLIAPQHVMAGETEPYTVTRGEEDAAVIELRTLDLPVLPRTLGFSADLMQDIFGLRQRIKQLAPQLRPQWLELVKASEAALRANAAAA